MHGRGWSSGEVREMMMLVRSRSTDESGAASDEASRHGDDHAITAMLLDARPVDPSSGALPVLVGTSVGRYVVLEEVGRGGMGRVLRAYDPKLQREVALKEVGFEILRTEDAARLVAEARAMAKLSHANVVTIYDVEELSESRGAPTEAARIVLVMEYVPGSTLQDWLRERARAWQDVLARFVAAGRGLAAAHAAGLMHRDFKPANVLVRDDGTVKVTDFGLSKAYAEPESSTRSSDALGSSAESSFDDGLVPVTRTGMVMGSPRYMAPEQHEGRALTAAADQYAFCVALWEALAGESPFPGTTLGALARSKRGGPPPWPNPAVPRPIADAIARGLSPAPLERWPSMDALLVALAPPATTRRARTTVVALGLGALALAGLVGRAWLDADRARCTGAADQLVAAWGDDARSAVQTAILGTELSYADDVWARTARELDAYVETWTSTHTEACEATTVRGEQSAAMMDLQMRCLRRARVELEAVTRALAQTDAESLPRAHEVVDGLPPLQRCTDLDALARDVEPPLPEDVQAVERAQELLAAARAASSAGHYVKAQQRVEEAMTILDDTSYAPAQAEALLLSADVLDDLGRYDECETVQRDALELATRSRDWRAVFEAATSLMFTVGIRREKVDEALRYRELAGGLSTLVPGGEATFLRCLGEIQHVQSDYVAAEASLRRAVELVERGEGSDHLPLATLRATLADTLEQVGKYDEAESEYRRTLAVREAVLGPEHPDVGMAIGSLASLLNARGQHETAEREHRRALVVLERALGPDHPHIPATHNNLGTALDRQGKYAEAEVEHRLALAGYVATLGPEHPMVARSHANIASALSMQDEFDEAEAAIRRSIELLTAAYGPDHVVVAQARHNAGTILRRKGDLAGAEQELRTALGVIETALGTDHPHVAKARTVLADLLLERGRPEEALLLARRAWTRNQHDDVPLTSRARTAFALAECIFVLATDDAQRAEAIAFAEQALADYERAGDGPEATDDVKAFLQRNRPRSSGR
jgi:tetratricopeptide (TPR) repeat protein/tRNA A-37 threonylcarbamoyl transferase component Bud32